MSLTASTTGGSWILLDSLCRARPPAPCMRAAFGGFARGHSLQRLGSSGDGGRTLRGAQARGLGLRECGDTLAQKLARGA